jgi:hypothetical protein
MVVMGVAVGWKMFQLASVTLVLVMVFPGVQAYT